MVSPILAVVITCAVVIVFAVVLPLLDSIKAFSETISTRWSIVVVFLAMGVGCVIDFEGLDNDIRHLVMVGCFVMSVLYVLCISIEKWLNNGWIGKAEVKLKVGNKSVSASLGSGKEAEKDRDEKKRPRKQNDKNAEETDETSQKEIEQEQEVSVSEETGHDGDESMTAEDAIASDENEDATEEASASNIG